MRAHVEQGIVDTAHAITLEAANSGDVWRSHTTADSR